TRRSSDLTPCVNKSEYHTTLYGKDIYLGFMHLQSLETGIAHTIVTERQKNGEYKSLEDFIKRIPLGIEAIQILIFIGAFNFTGLSKNELLIKARLLLINFKPQNRMPVLIETPT